MLRAWWSSSGFSKGAMEREVNLAVEAAVELQGALEEGGFPFCIIGGLAVQRWGEPRLTLDADATVLTRFERDEELAVFLTERFGARRGDAVEFALQNRVLLLHGKGGVHLDVALGALDFEVRSIERSSFWDYHGSVRLRTCGADDLVVHKAFAGRDQDWMDIDGILVRQEGKLNFELIFRELRPLVELKEEPGILVRLEKMMRGRGLI